MALFIAPSMSKLISFTYAQMKKKNSEMSKINICVILGGIKYQLLQAPTRLRPTRPYLEREISPGRPGRGREGVGGSAQELRDVNGCVAAQSLAGYGLHGSGVVPCGHQMTV